MNMMFHIPAEVVWVKSIVARQEARTAAELAALKSHYVNCAQTLSSAHGGPNPGSDYYLLSGLFMITFEWLREAWKMQIQTEINCFLCKQSQPMRVKDINWFELGTFTGMIEDFDEIVCNSMQTLFSSLINPIGVKSSKWCSKCNEEYLLRMRLTPPDILIILGGLAKSRNGFYVNNELSINITPISSSEENTVHE